MMILPSEAKAETIPATQLAFPTFGTARNPTVALEEYLRWKKREGRAAYESNTVDLCER
jgi:hypothetical protein